MPDLSAFPNIPSNRSREPALFDTSIKIATPDLIQTDEAPVPVEIVTKLLFEQIGGIEIIGVARSDIINGQSVSYNLIGNISVIQKLYNPTNIFKLVGSSKEFFENFGIRFVTHSLDSGSALAPVFIDVENIVPAVEGVSPAEVPIVDRLTGVEITTVETYAEAVAYINANYPIRDTVYIETTTGDLIIDVTGMEINERVEIEVLSAGNLEDDTIY